jgi:hypothetical protein
MTSFIGCDDIVKVERTMKVKMSQKINLQPKNIIIARVIDQRAMSLTCEVAAVSFADVTVKSTLW